MRAVKPRISEEEAAPTRRVFEEITSRIRRDLAAGKLRAGDKLPAERDLAQSLGVSRTAVREALRSLEIAGVIELKKGVKGGAFIIDASADLITRSIRDLMSFGRISMESLTEARILVLQMAVRLVCERATEAEFAALEANTARLPVIAGGDPTAERIAVSREFYGIIARATRNELLQVIVESLTDILLQMWMRSRVEALPGLIEARRELIALMRARDGDAAAEAMAQHLRNLHGHLMRSLGRNLALGLTA